MKISEKSKEIIKRFTNELEFYRKILKHPRTPRLSKVLLGVAIAYAVSPIDLIPDFIPVLGHIDDIIIVPILILTATRLIPKNVLEECRREKEVKE